MEFKFNEQLKKKILKEQIPKHPKWIKRKFLIRFMYFLRYGTIVVLPLLFYYLNASGIISPSEVGNVYLDILLESFAFYLLFCFAPSYLYFMALKNTCSYYSSQSIKETLETKPTGFRYGFEYRDNSGAYIVHDILYRDIKRIVVDELGTRVDIYCTCAVSRFSDPAKPYGVTPAINEDFVERIFMYFDNIDDFLDVLAVRSDVKIEYCSEEKLEG